MSDQAVVLAAPTRRRTAATVLRRSPTFWIGAVILAGLIIVSVLAPQLSPVDPNALAITRRLRPPSLDALLGTDHLGRDLLSRLTFGARYSLGVAFSSVGAAAIVGVALGCIAALARGLVEAVTMRIVDALMTFPTVLIALFVVATLGTGTDRVILALAIATVPQITRITRAEVLRLKQFTFVEAAQALGVGQFGIARKHIIVNALGPIIVAVTFSVGRALLAESTLGFLGLGVDVPTWGQIVGDGREYFRQAPWATVFGGTAIMLAVLAANLLGDALRDAMDPQMRH